MRDEKQNLDTLHAREEEQSCDIGLIMAVITDLMDPAKTFSMTFTHLCLCI